MKKTIVLILSSTVFLVNCNKNDDKVTPASSSNSSSGNLKIKVVQDTFQNQPVVVAGSSGNHFGVSFFNNLDGSQLSFEAVQDSLPIIMKDNHNNYWDITGEVISGPDVGVKLQSTTSYMGYWFAWATFFPGIEIYGNSENVQENDKPYSGDTWLIPPSEVISGGPPKDGIPALQNPELITTSNAQYLSGNDLVLGYKKGDDVRAYPHSILDWHEIINDEVEDGKIVITYCPLTGTGIAWNQNSNMIESTFGVSGLLYNSNLIPYDRATDSYWSQIKLECVHGQRIGEMVEIIQLIETKWNTWKKMFPETKVVSTNTGYKRNYGTYPYGDYKESEKLLFPVSINDNRLQKKEVVHGIILDGKAKVYSFNIFSNYQINEQKP